MLSFRHKLVPFFFPDTQKVKLSESPYAVIGDQALKQDFHLHLKT